MRNIIFISLLFINTICGQSLLILMGDDAGYDSEAQAYFGLMTTPLSKNRQDTINAFVVMLKDSLSISSLAGKFDVMYILANETAEASLKNLVADTNHCFNISSTAFAVDRGYTGDGSADYLTTNYNPSTEKVNLTQNSAGIGFYSRTDRSEAAYDCGAYIGTDGFMATNYTDLFASGVNSGATGTTANGVTTGMYIATRNDATNIYHYKNGVQLGNVQATASTAIPNGNIFICARNENGSPLRFGQKQIAFFFVSGGLSATEARKITNCIEWYLDAIGAGVIP